MFMTLVVGTSSSVATKIASPAIPVLPKSSHQAYQIENMDLFDWTLTDEDMAALTMHATPNDVVNGSGDCSVV